MLATPFDFADPGDAVRLSGTVTFPNTLGNQQFRFGLFNNNGHATGTLTGGLWNGADPGGWLGYRAEIGNGGGGDFLKGRDPASTGAYITNTGVDDVAFFGTPDSAPGNTPYDFELTLRRLSATSVSIEYLFQGGPINRSNISVDNLGTLPDGASTATTSFNAVGFLTNGNTGDSTFSNVKVEVPKDLRLQVDTGDGQVRIINQETIGFAINFYEIRSVSGALNPTGWTSIDGNAADFEHLVGEGRRQQRQLVGGNQSIGRAIVRAGAAGHFGLVGQHLRCGRSGRPGVLLQHAVVDVGWRF